MRLMTGPLTKLTAAMLCAFAGLNSLALADLPGAIDRVPSSAAVIIAMRDMEGANTKFNKFFESLGQPARNDDDSPMAVITKMLSVPGLNKSGSVAIAIIPGTDGKIVFGEKGEDDTTTAVIIAPVSDYAAFVKAMGADKVEGIASLKFDKKDGYAKDLGGGYAALTTISGLLDKFDGKAGMNAQHAKNMGKNGSRISDNADVILIANIPAMQEQIEEGGNKMKDQLEQMGAMVGQQGAGLTTVAKMAEGVVDGVLKDGQVGVLGFKFGETGVSIDLGAQFKEGSDFGKFFNSTGKSGALMSKIPNIPFFFAGAFDTSSPGVKQVVKNMAAANPPAPPKEGEKAGPDVPSTFGALVKNIEKIDGTAFILGSSPLIGGIFVNSLVYTATSDPKGFSAATAAALKEANGQSAGPAKTLTSYTEGVKEIDGVKVDTWSMKMEFAEQDQMSMVVENVLGAEGLNAMTAQVDKGVVTVYSQNTPLMTKAIAAAKSGAGALGDNEALKDAQANLPANRTMELFIGVKQLMDAGMGFYSMMGGGADITVPAKISPIAMGATTSDSGFDLRLFFPNDTIKGIADVMKQAKVGGGGDDEEDAPQKKDEPGKSPRF